MQLTPEILQQFAKTNVKKLVQNDSSILAAYLCGSALHKTNPLIGGTTDIDIILIHVTEPAVNREVLRLTDEVHLDIVHHTQDLYRQGRELRVHPWMGPTLNNAKPLYDPRHFLDFTQASVRGLFHREDNILLRARACYDDARRTWIGLGAITTALGPNVVRSYLEAVENATNSLALLVGEPLTERRLLLEFPQIAEELGQPRMLMALLGLIGGTRVDVDHIVSWLPAWDRAFEALPDTERPGQLDRGRKDYYWRAFEAILGHTEPKAVLWPLLTTWTLSASMLPSTEPAYQEWRDACQQLGLIASELSERVAALDVFLDQVDELLTAWEAEYGF
jgi:hypothetical protein